MDMNALNVRGNHQPCRILVVGVGGAGCNTLAAWHQRNREGNPLPDMVALHTDAQVLDASPVPLKIQLGSGITGGRGTGGDTKKGALCAEEAESDIRSVFRNYDLIFFIVGLGGGTGRLSSSTVDILMPAAGEEIWSKVKVAPK